MSSGRNSSNGSTIFHGIIDGGRDHSGPPEDELGMPYNLSIIVNNEDAKRLVISA